MENKEQIFRFIVDQTCVWEKELKAKWTGIENLDSKVLLLVLAFFETLTTDVLIRLQDLPKNSLEIDTETAKVQIAIYESNFSSLREFATGLLLATGDYLSVVHLIWLRLDKNEIHTELKRRASQLKITRAVWKLYIKEGDIKGLLRLIGNCIGAWWKGMRIIPNMEMRKWKKDLYKDRKATYSPDLTISKAPKDDSSDSEETPEEEKELDFSDEKKTLKDETKDTGWQTDNEDEMKEFRSKQYAFFCDRQWLIKVHLDETLAYFKEYFSKCYRAVFTDLNKLDLNSIPLSIIDHRKAPTVWNELAPGYFKQLVGVSFLMAPFFDGQIEKLPLKVHDRKKVLSETEAERKRNKPREEEISLDQLENQINEEGENLHLRDKVEYGAIHEEKPISQKGEQEYCLTRKEDTLSILKSIESEYTGPLRIQLNKALANHVMTNGKDIKGDCQISGLAPRTWYNFRLKHGLTREEEDNY